MTALMADVGKLRGLQTLGLPDENQVTNAGLAHLRGLSQLRCLSLGKAKVGGPGLAILRG